jgi:hypothetical protein
VRGKDHISFGLRQHPAGGVLTVRTVELHEHDLTAFDLVSSQRALDRRHVIRAFIPFLDGIADDPLAQAPGEQRDVVEQVEVTPAAHCPEEGVDESLRVHFGLGGNECAPP